MPFTGFERLTRFLTRLRTTHTDHAHRRPRLTRRHNVARVEQLETRALLTSGLLWQSQGPGPIVGGLVSGLEDDGDLVAGQIQAVLTHPTDSAVVYVGTAGGGVWKTQTANSPLPGWIPLTDHLPSLSVSSLAFDLTDSSYQTIVAGLGDFSDAS